MTKPLAPGPTAEVSASPDGGQWTLTFVRELRHSPAAVWPALTEPAEMRRWSPFTADRVLDEPGPFTLTMLDGDQDVTMTEEVLAAEAPRVLEHTWGEGRVRWELAPSDTGTRLTLHQTVPTEEFLPKAAAGWHLCLAVADRLLAGDPVPPVVGEAAMDHGWQDLHDAYAAALDLSD